MSSHTADHTLGVVTIILVIANWITIWRHARYTKAFIETLDSLQEMRDNMEAATSEFVVRDNDDD